jgi:proline iminopeptidase
VREHFGLETLALCGWSQGGLGAALYTLTHPERVDRLILIGSVGPQRIRYDGTDEAEAAGSARIRDDERAELDAMRDAERVEPVAFSRRFLRVIMSYQMADFTCAERMRSDPHRYPNEWPENLHPLSEATARAWMDVEFHPGSIRAPTLVIHGEGDVIPLAAARDWLRYADDARLLVVPGSGHWPWLERPDVFFPALQNFLR